MTDAQTTEETTPLPPARTVYEEDNPEVEKIELVNVGDYYLCRCKEHSSVWRNMEKIAVIRHGGGVIVTYVLQGRAPVYGAFQTECDDEQLWLAVNCLDRYLSIMRGINDTGSMTPDQIQKAIISNGGVMSNHDLINLIDSKDERISACGYDNAASVLRGMWNRGEIKRTMISVVKKSRRKGMYRVYADAWTYETYRHDLPENRW